MNKWFYALLLALFAIANVTGQDALIDIITQELEREYKELSSEEIPPYYIEYRVEDIESISMSSSFGSLTASDSGRFRLGMVNLKVGDYNLDNTHPLEEGQRMYSSGSVLYLPIENHSFALKKKFWNATESAYKGALNNYKLITEQLENGKIDTSIIDFSKEKPVTYFEPKLTYRVSKRDIKEWEKNLKTITSGFINDSLILMADAMLYFNTQRKYFVSTEKTSIVQNFSYAQLHLMVSVQDTSGNIIPYNKSYYAENLNTLPEIEIIKNDLSEFIETLNALKEAPEAQPYTGPAILSAKAAGVFFHEIFGHRIESHRLKQEYDGHTFKDKLNTKVLPKDFQVTFDPSVQQWENQFLNGYYKFDDEGVSGSKVNVVENGILNDFLFSRTPLDNQSYSNGHGRGQMGSATVSRQSNMFVDANKTYSDEDLRKKLIKECKKQKKEYGYFFDEVIGGFTLTDRYSPNVFNIIPTKVYRVYVDGRPDELVKGVGLIGTPLTMFSMIDCAGENRAVFNGFCGAESGSIPVSTISPSIFVRQIETQLTPNIKVEVPILSRPGTIKTN